MSLAKFGFTCKAAASGSAVAEKQSTRPNQSVVDKNAKYTEKKTFPVSLEKAMVMGYIN